VPSCWTAWSELGSSPSSCRIVGATWVVSTHWFVVPEWTAPGAEMMIGTSRSAGLSPPCSAIFAAAGVDDAGLDAAEHVRVARVRVGDAEERGGLVPSVDLLEIGVQDLRGAVVDSVVVVELRGHGVVPEVHRLRQHSLSLLPCRRRVRRSNRATFAARARSTNSRWDPIRYRPCRVSYLEGGP
jgi:hypothetical protein